MSLEDTILEDAARYVQQLNPRISTLEKEEAELKVKLTEVQASLNTMRIAHDGISKFQPLIGGKPQCIVCWGQSGTQVTLNEQSGTETEDIFVCRECGHNVAHKFL